MRKLWSMLLCICLALTGCGGNRDRAKISKESPGKSEFALLPIAPVREESHENYVQDVRGLLASARDSLARMNEAAAEAGAKADEIAQGAREACEPRLDELSEADLDAMPDEDLRKIMLEVSNFLTALREARDAIGALN